MQVRVRVHHGHLPLAIGEIEGVPGPSRIALNGNQIPHRVERIANGLALYLDEAVDVRTDEEISFRIGA